MGKKITKEMQAQRDAFVDGAIKNGIERYQADAIFDLLERFAEYGFNKSHAAAYALVAYQTAYMKANYPVEFLAASMTLDMGNTDKLAEFRAEAERLGIKVEPPSINRSHVAFEVDGNTIIYALAALKGVGRQAVEAIVAARGDAQVRRSRRLRRPHQSARRQQARAGKPGASRRLRRIRGQPRARVPGHGRGARRAPSARTMPRPSGRTNCSAAAATREPIALPQCRALAAGRAAAARIRGGRLFPLRPSARRLRRRAQETARAVLGRFFARGESRRDRRPRRRHRGVARRSGAPAPAARWASSGCPIRPATTRR